MKTNDLVGVMWPDDSDGAAERANVGPLLRKAGFILVDPGAYADGTMSYTSQINTFREKGIEILTSVPLASDFYVFWQQASEANLRPKIVTLGKTCQLPSQVEPLGASGLGISTGFWWTPQYPYSSTLTGQTAQQLASDYTSGTGSQWTQMLGCNLALFEIAVDVLKRASDPKDRQAVAAQLGRTNLTTIVGPLDWTSGPVKNVSTQPWVMAQWRQAPVGSGFIVEPVIVSNGAFHQIPLGGTLQPLI